MTTSKPHQEVQEQQLIEARKAWDRGNYGQASWRAHLSLAAGVARLADAVERIAAALEARNSEDRVGELAPDWFRIDTTVIER